MDNKNKDKVCCPKFDAAKWDEKVYEWKNKHFIMESIPTFFHIPFPPMIGKRVTKMWKMVEEAKKADPLEDTLLLFADPHPFKSELYLSVTGDVLNANNVQISGTFEGKVFDGPYNAVPKFIKEMNEYLAKKNKKAKKYYVHYAYCPGCAKKFGKNHMILFAEV